MRDTAERTGVSVNVVRKSVYVRSITASMRHGPYAAPDTLDYPPTLCVAVRPSEGHGGPVPSNPTQVDGDTDAAFEQRLAAVRRCELKPKR